MCLFSSRYIILDIVLHIHVGRKTKMEKIHLKDKNLGLILLLLLLKD